MKRFFSIWLSFICLLFFTFPVCAFSSNDTDLNSVELSAKRLSATISGKSETELANEILLSIGMDSKWVEKMPDDKKIEIANSYSIHCETSYSKINNEGVEIALTQSEYLEGLSAGNKNIAYDVQTKSSSNEIHYDGEDSYLIKNLYVYETQNAPTGTYGIIVTYEWKNYVTRWHGTDLISVSGEYLSFERDSFTFAGEYIYNQNDEENYTVGSKTVSADCNNLEDENDLKVMGNGIIYQFDLENNNAYLKPPLYYTNAEFMMIVSARVGDWSSPKTFNIYSSYFHQKLGLGSIGVFVSINSVSFSVSPKLCYVECQIATGSQINYIPKT